MFLVRAFCPPACLPDCPMSNPVNFKVVAWHYSNALTTPQKSTFLVLLSHKEPKNFVNYKWTLKSKLDFLKNPPLHYLVSPSGVVILFHQVLENSVKQRTFC